MVTVPIQEENPAVQRPLLVDALVSILPTMTTPTPSTTQPTIEAQATTISVTDPSPTMLKRLFKLEKKVDALSKVDHSKAIEEVVQAKVHNEVKNQLPKFLPKVVSDYVQTRLERTVRDMLKKELDNIFQSSSSQENFEYHLKRRKRHHNDDQDPLKDSIKEKNRRRRKDTKPSMKPTASTQPSKGTTPSKSSTIDKFVNVKDSVYDVEIHVEEPVVDAVEHGVNQTQDDVTPRKDSSVWFKQDPRPETPNPDWQKEPNVDVVPKQTWFTKLVNATKDPIIIYNLMGSTIDFSNFIMYRLKKDKITRADLETPVFKLLKRTCRSSIELEYNMEQCYWPYLISWIR
ncbi:hypothetical protein Tco_0280414 [Tanacetum coccineum]